MIYISHWDRANKDGERWFSGYLTEPQFSEPLKMISAETWILIVNYREGTYELWRGYTRRGYNTGEGGRVAKVRDLSTAYMLDTTYVDWQERFERILAKHGLKAWEPPEGWKWPEFVPLETALAWVEANASRRG